MDAHASKQGATCWLVAFALEGIRHTRVFRLVSVQVGDRLVVDRPVRREARIAFNVYCGALFVVLKKRELL